MRRRLVLQAWALEVATAQDKLAPTLPISPAGADAAAGPLRPSRWLSSGHGSA